MPTQYNDNKIAYKPLFKLAATKKVKTNIRGEKIQQRKSSVSLLKKQKRSELKCVGAAYITLKTDPPQKYYSGTMHIFK